MVQLLDTGRQISYTLPSFVVLLMVVEDQLYIDPTSLPGLAIARYLLLAFIVTCILLRNQVRLWLPSLVAIAMIALVTLVSNHENIDVRVGLSQLSILMLLFLFSSMSPKTRGHENTGTYLLPNTAVVLYGVTIAYSIFLISRAFVQPDLFQGTYITTSPFRFLCLIPYIGYLIKYNGKKSNLPFGAFVLVLTSLSCILTQSRTNLFMLMFLVVYHVASGLRLQKLVVLRSLFLPKRSVKMVCAVLLFVSALLLISEQELPFKPLSAVYFIREFLFTNGDSDLPGLLRRLDPVRSYQYSTLLSRPGSLLLGNGLGSCYDISTLLQDYSISILKGGYSYGELANKCATRFHDLFGQYLFISGLPGLLLMYHPLFRTLHAESGVGTLIFTPYRVASFAILTASWFSSSSLIVGLTLCLALWDSCTLSSHSKW